MPLARHILVTTSESFSCLAGQPYKGRHDRVKGTRELVIHPHFVLVYEVDSQWGKVYILRIKTSDVDAITMNNDELAPGDEAMKWYKNIYCGK